MQGFVHVVDDDASFRKAIERQLKHAGYDVATYASAEHLLDCLPSENIPSCILLDVQIPELSGPELQERLSELGSTLPIIFLTGYPDVRTTVRTIKAGAEDFLTKPVPSNKLLQAVERAIARLEEQAGCGSRPCRGIDPARAASFRPCRSRQSQQASRRCVRLHRTHHQGALPKGDGENAGSDLAGTCIPRRADRRCVGYRTDGLIAER